MRKFAEEGCFAVEYILGVSGADHVTKVQIAALDGRVLQSFTVGAINLLHTDESQAAHNLAEIFVTAQLAGYPVRQCRQVCAGVAGLSGPETVAGLAQILRGVMRQCGYHGDALLLSENQVALAGALGSTKGVILTAGNSSSCFGQNALGAQKCTGGMGRLADDDGSAYAIGREILRTVARAVDGRGVLTHLTAGVYRKFSLAGPNDFTRLLRSADFTVEQICDLAGILPQACQQRDQAAQAIVDMTVRQLCQLVEPVVKKLVLQKGALAVSGQVLLNDAFVGIAFKKEMQKRLPDLQCVPPRNDGVAGAVLLAKERLTLRRYA